MDYQAEQDMELEALQAILMDDLEGMYRALFLNICCPLIHRIFLLACDLRACSTAKYASKACTCPAK
jgi:hypothetical protein